MSFWRVNDGVPADLQSVLARVEHLVPTVSIKAGSLSAGLTPLQSSSNVEMLDWVLSDNDRWELCMKFTQPSEDGEIDTSVYAGADRATVTVELRRAGHVEPVLLAHLYYAKYSTGTAKANPAAHRQVRRLVRDRTLHDVRAVKTQLEIAARKKADEIEALRRKYLG